MGLRGALHKASSAHTQPEPGWGARGGSVGEKGWPQSLVGLSSPCLRLRASPGARLGPAKPLAALLSRRPALRHRSRCVTRCCPRLGHARNSCEGAGEGPDPPHAQQQEPPARFWRLNPHHDLPATPKSPTWRARHPRAPWGVAAPQQRPLLPAPGAPVLAPLALFPPL